MTANPEPALAPRGAGLPTPELFAARLLFRWRRLWTNRAGFQALFARERDILLGLARALEPAQAAQRVLIPRLRGMEDSSRYWSVWMTLDHLRIVNRGCTGVMRILAQGKVPDRVASTAAVKPSPQVDPSVIETFIEGCGDFLETSDGIADHRTRVRHAHPWFGPLDVAGWHAMAGFHMQLHRRQVERIIAGL